jgi:hypothetical protein
MLSGMTILLRDVIGEMSLPGALPFPAAQVPAAQAPAAQALLLFQL